MGWPATKATPANCNQGIVLHYDGEGRNLSKKAHSECIKYWDWCRRFHINDRGWLDIGYSYGVCPHGYTFVGRGYNRQQAAQPGGNTTWHSITLMTGAGEAITEVQRLAVIDTHRYLIGRGVHSAIRRHNNFVSTSCPGSIITRMIAEGKFKQGSKPRPTPNPTPNPKPPTVSDWQRKLMNALPTLRITSDGFHVRTWQGILCARGLPVKIDGDFGVITDEETRILQGKGGVKKDGIVGPITWAYGSTGKK